MIKLYRPKLVKEKTAAPQISLLVTTRQFLMGLRLTHKS